MKTLFNTIDEVLADLKLGKPVILVDDYDNDNTGDFIVAAEFLNEDTLKQIKKCSKGIINIVSTKENFNYFNIKALYEQPAAAYELAKVMSIALKDNHDILKTVKALLDSKTAPNSFVEPGVIFPIQTHEGGVLKRAGRPEALVDLLEMAQLKPFGLTSLIIKDNGEPYLLDELKILKEELSLKWVTVADLISLRKQRENFIERTAEANLPTDHGEFKIVGFENHITGDHHVALVKGEISPEDEVLVRVHSECLTGDAFGSMKCDCGEQLQAALQKIEKAGKGVLIYLRQEGRGIGLINKIKAYHLQDEGLDTVEANLALGFAEDLRDYGIGAQMLADLGVKKIKLMTNNPLKLSGLEGYGMKITSREAIQLNHNERNVDYMKTKQAKMGHMLKFKKDE